MATIRQRVDPPPNVSDMPLTAADASRFFLKLAGGDEEACRAVYTDSDAAREPVVVYGLRFYAGGEAVVHHGGCGSESIGRVEFGRLVAFVSGHRGSCFRPSRHTCNRSSSEQRSVRLTLRVAAGWFARQWRGALAVGSHRFLLEQIPTIRPRP